MADAAVQTEAQRLTGEAIIRAEKIEKYYAQPSQNRIQVMALLHESLQKPGSPAAIDFGRYLRIR